MIDNSFGEVVEQNSRISAYKESIDQQVRTLLKNGSSLEQIATTLGAGAFYDTIEGKKKSAGPVAHFSVKDFVDHQISSGQFLKLPQRIIESGEVILPPDSSEIITGSGTGMEERGMVPRNQAMMQLLSDLDLDYEIIDGENSPGMFRKLVYRIYSVDKLAKLVFVNDEQDNATYVIHTEQGQTWKDFSRLTKNQLQELPTDTYRKIRYPSDLEKWKTEIVALLTEQRFSLVEQAEPSNGEKKEYIAPPDGWYTRSALASKLNTAHSVIKIIADRYKNDEKNSYQNWFHNYNANNGQTREYLHPDLVAIISADLNSRQEPPEDWANNHTLASKWGVAHETIKKLASQYSESKPEWIKAYKDQVGKIVDYFHPDLVAKINAEYESKKKAPKGWMHRWGVMTKLGIASDTVLRFIRPFKETHQEWFKQYTDGKNRLTEYYHPDLVSLMEKSVQQRESAPEGWMTKKEIAEKFGITFDLVENLLKEYQDGQHQNWFRDYHSKGHTKREHIHPDLINILEQKIKLMEHAPAGWLTKGDIAVKYGIGHKPIKRIIGYYTKQTDPIWVKNYFNRNNMITEYIHPDLIQIIRDSKKDRQARN